MIYACGNLKMQFAFVKMRALHTVRSVDDCTADECKLQHTWCVSVLFCTGARSTADAEKGLTRTLATGWRRRRDRNVEKGLLTHEDPVLTYFKAAINDTY